MRKRVRKKVPAIHVLHALELAALHGQQWRGAGSVVSMTPEVRGEEPCDMCGELCYGRRCEDCRRACAEKGMTKQPSLYGVPPELQRWFSRPCPEY